MGEEVIKERAGIPKNTFYDLLVKILHLEKKARNIYTHMVEFNLPKEDVIDDIV